MPAVRTCATAASRQAWTRRSTHQIARLEEKAGKRFGDPDDPLLVSVRSGAAVSMPGMMDSILNVGLNDVSVGGLARSTGNEGFARDCYRRLIQMFGETVDGVSHDRFSPDDTVEHAREVYVAETGRDFPQDAREQLRRAIVRGVRVVELAACAGVSAHVRDPG